MRAMRAEGSPTPPGLRDRPPGPLGDAHSSPRHTAAAAARSPGLAMRGGGEATVQNSQEYFSPARAGWSWRVRAVHLSAPAPSSFWPQVADDIYPFPARAPWASTHHGLCLSDRYGD